jgi:hypothetical protein
MAACFNEAVLPAKTEAGQAGDSRKRSWQLALDLGGPKQQAQPWKHSFVIPNASVKALNGFIPAAAPPRNGTAHQSHLSLSQHQVYAVPGNGGASMPHPACHQADSCQTVYGDHIHGSSRSRSASPADSPQGGHTGSIVEALEAPKPPGAAGDIPAAAVAREAGQTPGVAAAASAGHADPTTNPAVVADQQQGSQDVGSQELQPVGTAHPASPSATVSGDGAPPHLPQGHRIVFGSCLGPEAVTAWESILKVGTTCGLQLLFVLQSCKLLCHATRDLLRNPYA